MNPTRILRGLGWTLIAALLLALLAWAFAAYRQPDRVGDLASFLQLCATIIGR
ncbi:MAG: hypothetical protein R3E87_15205 [Burkholderiaceae bacterium]